MKLTLYISIFILGAFLTSCTETIDLTLDDPASVLVVDGYITNQDTVQWVRISSIENYFAEGLPNFTLFKDSKVYLIENSIVADTYSFNETTNRFEIQFQGKELNNYQIDITTPDGERYISSEELMGEPVPIDTIWAEINQDPGGPGAGGQEITVLINTKEPKGLGDNYQWKSYVNDQYQFESSDIFAAEDRFVDGQDINNFDIFGMSEDEYQTYAADDPNGKVFVKIEQNKITYRYYKYLMLVSQQLNQIGSPFAAPPAEIRGNVYKQGANEVLALGYFYTAGVSTKQVEIVE